ncbi:MAG: sulfatase-like hydrolase/transferase [Myxococcota bacterium]
MTNEKSLGRWPFVLVALIAIGIYLYSSISFDGSKPADDSERVSASAEAIEALADRDDLNVLFILIDTLRADRMSAYGYERETTPFMKTLSDTGIRFDRHIAQSSWTKSSMASLWTGLYPLNIGVTKFDHAVSQDAVLAPELLSEEGFKTVGIYRNGWVNGYFGFDQGFDRYYKPIGHFLPPEVRRVRPNDLGHGSDQDLMMDAKEFFRIHGKTSRWFVYIHLMDLHEYTYDEESAIFGTQTSDIYDNSLLRTDWMISQLYEYLESQEILENTMIVILSDHGEAFGERGFEGHAREVFPETTETPLIISLPTRFAEGIQVKTASTNMDVWPTLFELMGLPGQQEIDGVSRYPEILAAAEGRASDPNEKTDERVYAFLDENWGKPDPEQKSAVTVIEGPYRFVSGSGISGQPFESLLSFEDGEKEELLEAKPEIAAKLREAVEAHIVSESRYSTPDLELDEMQLDQLRALGYELP